jgi:hypothetical protein
MGAPRLSGDGRESICRVEEHKHVLAPERRPKDAYVLPQAGEMRKKISSSRRGFDARRSPERTCQTTLAAIPIFVRSNRQWKAGSITIGRARSRVSLCSPGAKASFRIRLRQKRRQNADRRCSSTAALRYGARLANRARLSAFHWRLSLGGCHPPTQLQAMLPGTRRECTISWTALRRRPCISPRALPRARLSQSRVSTPAPVIMPEG